MAGFDPELDRPTEDDLVEAELVPLDRQLDFLLRTPGTAFKLFSDEFHRHRHGQYPW